MRNKNFTFLRNDRKFKSIWLGRLQRDDSEFFLYTLKTLFSCHENETNSFIITPKLSQKPSSNKVDTFRYLRFLNWTRRSWGKRKIEILLTSESSSPLGWEDFKKRILDSSLPIEIHAFLLRKWSRFIR